MYLPAVFRQIDLLWSLTVPPDERLAPLQKAVLELELELENFILQGL